MYSANQFSDNLYNGVMNGRFTFSGEPAMLQTRINQISAKQIHQINEAHISLNGHIVKQANEMCTICTFIWGAIIIFPLFFLCCNWWKRTTQPLYDVPYFAYGVLERLLTRSNIVHLRFQVYDNFFDDSKVQVLYDIISKSPIKSFHFANMAQAIDVKNNEFSDFKERMAPFKKLNISSEIRWNLQAVL